MINQNSNFKIRYFLIFILTSILIYFLDGGGYLKFIHIASDFFIVPVKKPLYRLKQDLSGNKLNPAKNNNNDLLKNRDNQITALSEKVKILEAENKTLRKQLETDLPLQWEYIDAQTIGLSPELSVNKGQKNGLKIGETVLLENILVGKINKITFNQSQVLLPTDSSSKIPVYTGKSQSRGVLKGSFGTKITLENVLQEDELEVGETVLTSGEGDYPKNLLIGKIKKISKKATNLYQSAEVEPLLNYERLETVFILVNQ